MNVHPILSIDTQIHGRRGMIVRVMPSPLQSDRRTLNGDPAFPFLGQKVRHGIPGIHPSDLPYHARQGQHAFRHRRFTGIDVRQNANVANPGQPRPGLVLDFIFLGVADNTKDEVVSLVASGLVGMTPLSVLAVIESTGSPTMAPTVIPLTTTPVM